MEINLNKFDITSIKQSSIVLCIGRRETGKTTLNRDILYHYKNNFVNAVKVSYIDSKNSKNNDDIVSNEKIYEEYDPEIISDFLSEQKKIIHSKTDNWNSLLLLDDCFYDILWCKDRNIRQIIMNGKLFRVMMIMNLQYPMKIPADYKVNIDYIFIFRDGLINNRKKIFEQYLEDYMTLEEFFFCMDKYTYDYKNDYVCLVINNNAKTNKIEDILFWYKAEPHPNFKVVNDVLMEEITSN